MRNNPLRTFSVGLLLLVALLRGTGGAAMIRHGQDILPFVTATAPTIRAAGALMLLLSVAAALSGLILLRSPVRRAYIACGASMVLLFLDGAVNGYLLLGSPQFRGQLVNAIILVVVLASLIASARRDRSMELADAGQASGSGEDVTPPVSSP